jgi:hypothetical protein
MSKKLLVVGRGPSWERAKEIPDDYEMVLFINTPQIFDSANRDEELLERLKSKKVIMYTNMPQRLVAFQEHILNFFNVDECAIARCSPNWPLWREHKAKQKRVCPAWKQLSWLPPLEEDEPYMYIWRGPEPANAPEMFTPGGRKINHLVDEAEPYLASVYGDRMMCNCSIFASLYAILKLQADHIYYCGLDFYHDLKVAKESYLQSPAYMSGQNWWQLRVKTEGEHTKIVYDEYMTKFFPDVTYEFYTDADWTPSNKNVVTHCSGKEIIFKKYDSNYYKE